jgi:hypothetical protein
MSFFDRLVGAMCVAALAGAPACGSDEEPTADTSAGATQADGDSAPARSADMTIEALCDPPDHADAPEVVTPIAIAALGLIPPA